MFAPWAISEKTERTLTDSGPRMPLSHTSSQPMDGGLVQGSPSISLPETSVGFPAPRQGEVVKICIPSINSGSVSKLEEVDDKDVEQEYEKMQPKSQSANMPRGE